ncbi:hypothetical protein EG68_04995 [Paragonimus skrjabini miyazakii]|uniref:Uncharacterized protein n=1 Tax=Paragonimus skrjabini miyazakii TaxID=59628 RepID=A0A8S9YX94_9TREM|nr:hypothetical protein EG68_04995 [Paragonimus skrjabini miyazakii]
MFYHGTELHEFIPSEHLCDWVTNAVRSTTRLCHEALLICNAVPQPWSSQLVEFTIHLYFSSKCMELRCPTLSKNESVQRVLKEINRRLNPYEDIPDYISSLAFMGMRNVTLQSALLYATLNSNWTQEALRDKNSDIFKHTKTLLQHEIVLLVQLPTAYKFSATNLQLLHSNFNGSTVADRVNSDTVIEFKFTAHSGYQNRMWQKLFYHGSGLHELSPNEHLCEWITDALRSTNGPCHESLLTCNAVPQPWSPRDIPDYISSLAFLGIKNVTLQSALLYVTLNSNWTHQALQDKNSEIFKHAKTLLQHELQKMLLFQHLQNRIIQMDIKNIGLTQTSSATAYIRLFTRVTDPKLMNPTFLSRDLRELIHFMEHTQFIALRKIDVQNNYYILELRIEYKELSEQKRKQLNDKDSHLYQIILHRSTVQTNMAIQACKWGNMIQNITVQLQGTNNSSESISQTALLVMSVDRVNLYGSNLNINHLVNCIIDGFEQEQYSRIIRNIDIKDHAQFPCIAINSADAWIFSSTTYWYNANRSEKPSSCNRPLDIAA